MEDCCERGAFVDLQIELRPDGEADPLERVAQYTREHRGMRARQRARRERREGDAPDEGS